MAAEEEEVQTAEPSELAAAAAAAATALPTLLWLMWLTVSRRTQNVDNEMRVRISPRSLNRGCSSYQKRSSRLPPRGLDPDDGRIGCDLS